MTTPFNFDFVEFIPADAKRLGVAIIVLNKNIEIFLTKRLKTGEYGCPGGKVDENDFSFEDAARRELLEETGLSVEEERLYWIGYQKVATDETDYTCWYVLVLEPNEVLMNTEPEKHGDWVPYKFTETMGLPLSCGTKQVIDVLSEQLIKYRNYNNYKDIFISEELEFENLKKMETYGPIQI